MVNVAEHLSSAPVRSLPHSKPGDRFDLYWLPSVDDWPARFRKAVTTVGPEETAWRDLLCLAKTRLNFIRTGQLDSELSRRFGDAPPRGLETKPIRLAVLGSSTVTHLLPGIRVATLRRGIWLTAYEAAYGQYLQELHDDDTPLHAFKPNAVLFAFDTPHIVAAADAGYDILRSESIFSGIKDHLKTCWQLARERFKCPIIQQTLLPVFPSLMGSNEHRLPGSKSRMTARLNEAFRLWGVEEGIDILALDTWAAQDGLTKWYDPALWHRSKQEIRPVAAPLYGEAVARILAAQQGRAAKCLVMDLDNTLWGGVIGDDGLENIVLGQGSALGEAFLNFQSYAADLAKRGVILAVCSKNDESNALAPFQQHPDMLLKKSDIAAFVANWDDKAVNLRRIAQSLNIGLDSLVFVDDNPFERNLIRRELPMVAVPEVGEDPATFANCLADAG
jgi:HAD superfamily phosphatase (TIGR01681 family)